jgi:hypothetical protein
MQPPSQCSENLRLTDKPDPTDGTDQNTKGHAHLKNVAFKAATNGAPERAGVAHDFRVEAPAFVAGVSMSDRLQRFSAGGRFYRHRFLIMLHLPTDRYGRGTNWRGEKPVQLIKGGDETAARHELGSSRVWQPKRRDYEAQRHYISENAVGSRITSAKAQSLKRKIALRGRKGPPASTLSLREVVQVLETEQAPLRLAHGSSGAGSSALHL